MVKKKRDSARETISLRVFSETWNDVRDEQDRLRKTTGHEPTLAEIVDSAWKIYKGGASDEIAELLKPRGPVITGRDQKHHEDFQLILDFDEEFRNAILANVKTFRTAIKTRQEFSKMGPREQRIMKLLLSILADPEKSELAEQTIKSIERFAGVKEEEISGEDSDETNTSQRKSG